MRLAHHRAAAEPPLRSGCRRRSERGAVIVEMALAAPLLVLLVMGSFEFGMAWRSTLSVSSGARVGVRTGSSLGTDPLADFYALSALRSNLQSANLINNVQKVVIYRSDTTNGAVPASCVSGSSGKCDLITGAQLIAMTQGSFDSNGCFTGASLQGWCPAARNNAQATADYYGMYVEVTHNYMTNMFGSSVSIKRTAVMRLEPDVN